MNEKKKRMTLLRLITSIKPRVRFVIYKLIHNQKDEIVLDLKKSRSIHLGIFF